MNAPNPKQAMGDRKVNLSLIPPAAAIYMCQGLQYGAFKAPRADGQPPGYGPYNWRESKIEAMTYVAAALRHIFDWLDGEEDAPDSNAPHLGHAMASLAILVDAKETDNLIDNRPKPGAAPRLLAPKADPAVVEKVEEELDEFLLEQARNKKYMETVTGIDVCSDFDPKRQCNLAGYNNRECTHPSFCALRGACFGRD